MLASFAARTYRGRSFQILGPYTRKLRSPARFEVRGIVRRESFPVLRDLAGAYGVTSSFRYAGACPIVGKSAHPPVCFGMSWSGGYTYDDVISIYSDMVFPTHMYCTTAKNIADMQSFEEAHGIGSSHVC